MESTEPKSDHLRFCETLRDDFKTLKTHSLSCKMKQKSQNSGDIVPNPLDAQFTAIEQKLEQEMKTNPVQDSQEFLRLVAMKSAILYEKAKLYLAENLLTESRENLEASLALIADRKTHVKFAFLYLRIVNHLAYVFSRIGEVDKAKDLLEDVMEVEKTRDNDPEIITTEDLFTGTDLPDRKQSSTKLNKLTINNLQMLAWIYTKTNRHDEQIRVQFDILQKQLDYTDCDAITWAQNCYRLAAAFLSRNQWEHARYLLCAADTVLAPLEATLTPNHELHRTQADVARSWVFYGIQLFDASRRSQLENVFRLDEEIQKKEKEEEDTIKSAENQPKPEEEAQQETDKSQEPSKSNPTFVFHGIDVEIPEGIPASKITNLQDAKTLFYHTQKYVRRARLYYTLRDFPLQYVNLCLDLSELFRFLSFYETDLESQYAVLKKRYDSLESLCSVLKELRPNCYVALSVELTKELVEAQIELMNINLRKMFSSAEGSNSPDTLKRTIEASNEIYAKLDNVQSAVGGSEDVSEQNVPFPERS